MRILNGFLSSDCHAARRQAPPSHHKAGWVVLEFAYQIGLFPHTKYFDGEHTTKETV